MVTQIQAISRRDSEDIAARFKQKAAAVRREAGMQIAELIVARSPVDTGTYIMAHSAGGAGSDDGASRSSAGKPRGRNPNQFRALALGNLQRSVSAMAIEASGEIWFRNRAEHAAEVEYLGWGNKEAYYVYSDARREAPAIIARVVREMGFETR